MTLSHPGSLDSSSAWLLPRLFSFLPLLQRVAYLPTATMTMLPKKMIRRMLHALSRTWSRTLGAVCLYSASFLELAFPETSFRHWGWCENTLSGGSHFHS